MKARILCVAGARPNFMKLARLVAALERDPERSPLSTLHGAPSHL
jgi:UDP-N-acetylglucosamine 2-epimerase